MDLLVDETGEGRVRPRLERVETGRLRGRAGTRVEDDEGADQGEGQGEEVHGHVSFPLDHIDFWTGPLMRPDAQHGDARSRLLRFPELREAQQVHCRLSYLIEL